LVKLIDKMKIRTFKVINVLSNGSLFFSDVSFTNKTQYIFSDKDIISESFYKKDVTSNKGLKSSSRYKKKYLA
jgi:hypothetical protein